MTVLADPQVSVARVTTREALGAYAVLWFEAPEIATGAQPGQFVMVAIGDAAGCILRRPFSIYAARGGQVAIAFDAIGAGTRWLAERTAGDGLEVIGPLGTPQPAPEDGAILVGGGYGTAALSFLAERATAAGQSVRGIAGARTADRLFIDDSLRGACESLAITTDDGSAGLRGIVTEPLREMLATAPGTVFSCGPNPMLAAVRTTAADAGVESYLAVEEFMACGVGVCWTCVVPVRVDGEVKHLRCCTEGPVFRGGDVAWG